MHPSVRSQNSEKCPIGGMDLIPVMRQTRESSGSPITSRPSGDHLATGQQEGGDKTPAKGDNIDDAKPRQVLSADPASATIRRNLHGSAARDSPFHSIQFSPLGRKCWFLSTVDLANWSPASFTLDGSLLRADEDEERYYQIIDGLQEGECIVSNGNFLIDAEAQVQGAVRNFGEKQAPVSNGADSSGPIWEK
jgi:hypothetical protein